MTNEREQKQGFIAPDLVTPVAGCVLGAVEAGSISCSEGGVEGEVPYTMEVGKDILVNVTLNADSLVTIVGTTSPTNNIDISIDEVLSASIAGDATYNNLAVPANSVLFTSTY